jgi:hypothetical protein
MTANTIALASINSATSYIAHTGLSRSIRFYEPGQVAEGKMPVPSAMKRRSQGLKSAVQKGAKRPAPPIKSAKEAREGTDLERALSLIRTYPGIRPSELNRLLNREQSDGLRNTLIRRRLIRKERDGSAMRYYPV